MSIVHEISEMLQKGNAPKVKALVEQALAENVPAKDILNDGMIAGMMEVGQKFKENKVYVFAIEYS